MCSRCGRRPFLNLPVCEEHWESKRKPFSFHKFKEKHMRDFLQPYIMETFGVPVEWDRQLEGTPFRPDFFFRNYHGVPVVLEVDEHQHKNYREERGRMEKIRERYPSVIFVRVNVDSYEVEGKTHPGLWKSVCWVEDGEVKCRVHAEEGEAERRKQAIKELLFSLFSDPFFRPAEVWLFYDEG